MPNHVTMTDDYRPHRCLHCPTMLPAYYFGAVCTQCRETRKVLPQVTPEPGPDPDIEPTLEGLTA